MSFHLVSTIVLLCVASAFAQAPMCDYLIRKPRGTPLYSSDLVNWVTREYGPFVDCDSTVGYMLEGVNSSIVVYAFNNTNWLEVDNPATTDPSEPHIYVDLDGDLKTTLVNSTDSPPTSGLPSNFTPVPLSLLTFNVRDAHAELFWLVNITDGLGVSTVTNVTALKPRDEYSSFVVPTPYVAPLTLEVAASSNQTLRLVLQEQPPLNVAYFPNGGDAPVFRNEMVFWLTFEYGKAA